MCLYSTAYKSHLHLRRMLLAQRIVVHTVVCPKLPVATVRTSISACLVENCHLAEAEPRDHDLVRDLQSIRGVWASLHRQEGFMTVAGLDVESLGHGALRCARHYVRRPEPVVFSWTDPWLLEKMR